jgi:hypothetical protein
MGRGSDKRSNAQRGYVLGHSSIRIGRPLDCYLDRSVVTHYIILLGGALGNAFRGA